VLARGRRRRSGREFRELLKALPVSASCSSPTTHHSPNTSVITATTVTPAPERDENDEVGREREQRAERQRGAEPLRPVLVPVAHSVSEQSPRRIHTRRAYPRAPGSLAGDEACRIVAMKDRKAAPSSTTSKSKKSKKASSRVTAAKWEAAAAAGAAGRRAQRQAIGQASVAKVATRQFQKTRGQAIQAHIAARGRRQQARRDSR
jgi:hypothetical protein